jgi:uncharacterized protein YlzI (FlbEa/FlbD family)
MKQEHLFVKLTLEDFHGRPVYISPHEIGVLVPKPSYTEITLRSNSRTIVVKENIDEIFQRLDELHDKAVKAASEALRKNMHHGTAFAINDPGVS